MTLLIDNIGQLAAVPPGPVAGAAMRHAPIIENAAIVVEDGRIAWFGRAADAPNRAYDDVINAAGRTVVPGLIDCHTHAVFAGSREHEFVRKIEGASYLQILESGGGILSTMRAVRAAGEADLIEQSLPRLRRMIEWGATTIEIKSGYGLSPEAELKMLSVVRSLRGLLPIEIVPTYLGAHTIPPEFDGRPDQYIDAITDPPLLDRIAKDGLAEFADVFCERGAFSVDQGRRFLTRCRDAGLTPKIHAEQLSHMGGTRMAIEVGAASADHLECITDDDISALLHAATIPVVLPGCSFFLRSEPAGARRMIDAGLPVALATDCNPGSCMIESLPLVMSVAATLLRMTPIECLVACSANAAAALKRQDRIGAIAVGFDADLLILDTTNVNQWMYRVGVNPVAKVLKRGAVILDRG